MKTKAGTILNILHLEYFSNNNKAPARHIKNAIYVNPFVIIVPATKNVLKYI